MTKREARIRIPGTGATFSETAMRVLRSGRWTCYDANGHTNKSLINHGLAKHIGGGVFETTDKGKRALVDGHGEYPRSAEEGK